MSLVSITRTALTVAAVAVATFTATTIGSSEAEAHRRHRHHHRFHAHLLVAPTLIASGYVGSCYYLKVRAAETGSAYWYRRYLACIGE